MIEVLTIRTYKCILFLIVFFLRGVVMLCGFKVKSEQISLESFAEDGE